MGHWNHILQIMLHKKPNYFQEERAEVKSCVDQLALEATVYFWSKFKET